jgi:hypothetical protein
MADRNGELAPSGPFDRGCRSGAEEAPDIVPDPATASSAAGGAPGAGR